MKSDLIYEYQGGETDRYGRALWSCTRDGAGICGFGPTPKEALEDFLDKEQELLPIQFKTIFPGSNEEPADYKVCRVPFEDEA
jgi:hypothetical protein